MKHSLDNGDQHVSGHGAPDLRLHRVLAGAEKSLNPTREHRKLPLGVQIVDTPESPETTVNAGFTVGKQQIDRTLVAFRLVLVTQCHNNFAEKQIGDAGRYPGCCKNSRPFLRGSVCNARFRAGHAVNRRSSPPVRSRNSGLESSKRLPDRALMRFKRFYLCNWQGMLSAIISS